MPRVVEISQQITNQLYYGLSTLFNINSSLKALRFHIVLCSFRIHCQLPTIILNLTLLTQWISEGHIAVSGVPDETLDYRSVVSSAEKVNFSMDNILLK